MPCILVRGLEQRNTETNDGNLICPSLKPSGDRSSFCTLKCELCTRRLTIPAGVCTQFYACADLQLSCTIHTAHDLAPSPSHSQPSIILGGGTAGCKSNGNAGAIGRTGDANHAVGNNPERRKGSSGNSSISGNSCRRTRIKTSGSEIIVTAENAVRKAKKSTSALLVQSGLSKKVVGRSNIMLLLLAKHTDKRWQTESHLMKEDLALHLMVQLYMWSINLFKSNLKERLRSY